jgi:hypothetical protein
MILGILIGLIVWFVVPIYWNQHVKRKKNKIVVNRLCTVIGIFIVVLSSLKYIIHLLS